MITQNIGLMRKNLPSHVTIMAVTKQRTLQEIQQAISAGVAVIGENYLQEAAKRYTMLANVEKHFIGHLQKNKVKKVLEIFDWIDSVDSLGLAQEISKLATTKIPILVQVNAGLEKQKFGLAPTHALQFIKEASSLPHIAIKGLQIVVPQSGTPEDSRPYFKQMKLLFDVLKNERIPNVEMNVLSMGMTAEYVVAAQEGSTLVRIGEGIFGKREK